MIHLVDHRNLCAYTVQLGQLAATIRDDDNGFPCAAVKRYARPTLKSDDGLYVLMVDADGGFAYGVSLRPADGVDSAHRLLPSLSAPSPSSRCWECLFFTRPDPDRSVTRAILAHFWNAALTSITQRGAERLIGLDLDVRNSLPRIVFDLAVLAETPLTGPMDDRNAAIVIQLASAVAPMIDAEQIERLFAPLSRDGWRMCAEVRKLLDFTLRLADTHGSTHAIERLDDAMTAAWRNEP